VRKADNLPPSCAIVTKSGSLNFLEPSGPVQACNGTALPFYCQLTQEGLCLMKLIFCIYLLFISEYSDTLANE